MCDLCGSRDLYYMRKWVWSNYYARDGFLRRGDKQVALKSAMLASLKERSGVLQV